MTINITKGIDSGVHEAFLDKSNMSIVIFTKNNLCICIDYITRNLNTAFIPNSTYNSFMHDKCKQIKFSEYVQYIVLLNRKRCIANVAPTPKRNQVSGGDG